MAVRPIVLYPDPVLKTPTAPAPGLTPEVVSLIEDLVDTMHAGPGSVGVAAPQIGVSLRVCVVDVSENRRGKENNHGLLLMVNPEIVAKGNETAVMREGCMSVPDYTGDVERATEVTVRFLEPKGETREFTATGFEAVAIQHEIDHLDGFLFLDRIASLKTGLFRRKSYK